MVDHENPKSWTGQYVDSHRGECLHYLRETNLLVIRYIKDRRYTVASVGIDGILGGLDAFLKSGKSDRVRSCIAAYSGAAAKLTARADPDAVANELLKLDDDFFVPEIMQCAPNQCYTLDKARLVFCRR